MSGQNHFGDVQKELDQRRGVLEGAVGWDVLERVDEKVAPDRSGMCLTCSCSTCGSKLEVTLPWIELITAGAGVIPADAHTRVPWQWLNGYLYPPVICGCGRPVPLPLTPEKANKYLGTAVQLQILTPQMIQQKQQEARALSQQGRR